MWLLSFCRASPKDELGNFVEQTGGVSVDSSARPLEEQQLQLDEQHPKLDDHHPNANFDPRQALSKSQDKSVLIVCNSFLCVSFYHLDSSDVV